MQKSLVIIASFYLLAVPLISHAQHALIVPFQNQRINAHSYEFVIHDAINDGSARVGCFNNLNLHYPDVDWLTVDNGAPGDPNQPTITKYINYTNQDITLDCAYYYDDGHDDLNR